MTSLRKDFDTWQYKKDVANFECALLWLIFDRNKNVCGSEPNLGSTMLPPIPKVSIPKNNKPQYQHFNMNYAHVQPFR